MPASPAVPAGQPKSGVLRQLALVTQQPVSPLQQGTGVGAVDLQKNGCSSASVAFKWVEAVEAFKAPPAAAGAQPAVSIAAQHRRQLAAS